MIVRINVEEAKGLFWATSDDLKGLLVAEGRLDAIPRAVKRGIADLFLANDEHVEVLRVDDKTFEVRPMDV